MERIARRCCTPAGLRRPTTHPGRPPPWPACPLAAEECQAGAILASSIMRQQEELDLRQRQAAEQQRWDQQESEEESEEEEAAGEGQAAGQRGAGAAAVAAAQQQRQQQGDRGAGAAAAQEGPGEGAEEEEDGSGGADYIRISEEEQQDNAAAFLDAMRQRFLSGQDAGVDYAAIDAGGGPALPWAARRRAPAICAGRAFLQP